MSGPPCSALLGPRGITWLILPLRVEALTKEVSKMLIIIVSLQIRRYVKDGLSCVKIRTLLMLKMHERVCSLLFGSPDYYKRHLKYELLDLPVPKRLKVLKDDALPTRRIPKVEGKNIIISITT